QMEIALLGRYVKARLDADRDFPTSDFVELYVTLGALRATKNLGIFARLDKHDGKPQYLRHIPRLWPYLRRALIHPAIGDRKALPHLGSAPFFHMNSDTLWLEGVTPNLSRLAAQFDNARMDILLLLASTATSIGYEGRGDFNMAPDGRLSRRAERQVAPFVYAGAAVLSPAIFLDAPKGAFSLNRLFDRAVEAGRLYGLRLDGTWMHVGTPASIQAAEAAILESVA